MGVPTMNRLRGAMNLILVLVLALAAMALDPVFVGAQHDDAERVEETVGPYKIGVTANRFAPYSGDVDFVITVLDATTEQPVPGAQVRIRTRNETNGNEGWAVAVNTRGTPEVYKADVKLETPGSWEASIEVSSQMGDATVALPSLEVQKTVRSSSAGFVYVGVSLVIVLGGVYVCWSIRRSQRKRVRKESS